jgi:mannose-6-phosphate isomerase-like protein (cupin superfamily)/rubrerythrin
MHYDPRAYLYPYYPMSRSDEESFPEICDAILGAIKREASAMELYRQLAYAAPNQQHKNDILHGLEGKNARLMHFTNLYTSLTGTQPVYQVEPVYFYNYQDGLQRAYEAEVQGYEEYQRSCMLTQNPQVQNVFLWALADEQRNAARLCFLNEEVSNRKTDYGPEPFVVDINEATLQNNTFRTAIWTGKHLQVTLMSINVGEEIGLENHPELDQFLRIEQGQGKVMMGKSKDRLDFQKNVEDDFAILIPAGTWHNLINTGNQPLKLYSIYAPPQHPYGTIHETKADAMAAEAEHQH